MYQESIVYFIFKHLNMLWEAQVFIHTLFPTTMAECPHSHHQVGKGTNPVFTPQRSVQGALWHPASPSSGQVLSDLVRW